MIFSRNIILKALILIAFFSSAPCGAQPVETKEQEPKALEKPPLCVVDYDLTLSTHDCPDVPNEKEVCSTYDWTKQGIAKGTLDLIKRCLDEGAYVGILSLAEIKCHEGKIGHLVSKVPEFKNLLAPVNVKPIDITSKSQWNQDIGPFHFNPRFFKPKDIDRIMKFYGLIPGADDHRVIFWDDDSQNIHLMKEIRPKINSVKIERTSESPPSGCGITFHDVNEGFRLLEKQKKCIP